MELRVLNYFLMVAREENITKAAQLLHITQPTLSRQLMQLEDELGVKLFKRSNHNIILTDEGMLLKRRAQELISLAEKTKREFQQNEQLSGEIAIGSGEFKSFTYFSSIIAYFRQRYPLVRFEIYSGNADNIKDRIESGLLDIGLLSDPVDISKYEFIRLPEKEVWGILTHEDSDLARKGYAAPKDLINQNLMISHRALVQSEFENWLGDDIENINIVTTYNLLYNVAIMVQKKMGIALCIDLDCKYENLCFVPLIPRFETATVLVWKKNQTASLVFDKFLEYIKKCVTGISYDSI